jgi:hypothetical protein
VKVRVPFCFVRVGLSSSTLSSGKRKVETRGRGKGRSASSVARAASSVYAVDKALTGWAYGAPALV